MEHQTYKRIVPDAQSAILFVHGILGTPKHFRDLTDLVPEGISVCNLLLDGHGKGVREFSKTSMIKWETQVEAAVDELAQTHAEICIVAHSMGTLFAIEQAIKNEKVKKLFLLAAPLKLSLKPRMVVNVTKVYFNRVNPDNPVEVAARECCGVTQSKNLFSYLGWIPRYLELFAKIRQTGKHLPLLHTPCLAFQSEQDELVSVKSAAILETNPAVTVHRLENSSHYYYEPSDYAQILTTFQNWI